MIAQRTFTNYHTLRGLRYQFQNPLVYTETVPEKFIFAERCVNYYMKTLTLGYFTQGFCVGGTKSNFWETPQKSFKNDFHFFF